MSPSILRFKAKESKMVFLLITCDTNLEKGHLWWTIYRQLAILFRYIVLRNNKLSYIYGFLPLEIKVIHWPSSAVFSHLAVNTIISFKWFIVTDALNANFRNKWFVCGWKIRIPHQNNATIFAAYHVCASVVLSNDLMLRTIDQTKQTADRLQPHLTLFKCPKARRLRSDVDFRKSLEHKKNSECLRNKVKKQRRTRRTALVERKERQDDL